MPEKTWVGVKIGMEDFNGESDIEYFDFRQSIFTDPS